MCTLGKVTQYALASSPRSFRSSHISGEVVGSGLVVGQDTASRNVKETTRAMSVGIQNLNWI